MSSMGQGSPPSDVLMLGASGAGKSLLLARLLREWVGGVETHAKPRAHSDAPVSR